MNSYRHEYVLAVIFPSHELVTRGMMRERAVELAVISGRHSHDVAKCDWEQAKQELTRRPNADCRVSRQVIFAPWTQQRSENHD